MMGQNKGSKHNMNMGNVGDGMGVVIAVLTTGEPVEEAFLAVSLVVAAILAIAMAKSNQKPETR